MAQQTKRSRRGRGPATRSARGSFRLGSGRVGEGGPARARALPGSASPLARAVEAIARRLEQVSTVSTFIGLPRWFAYITSSPNPVGVLGDVVTSALNSNLTQCRTPTGSSGRYLAM